jgi:hypothetical protein
LPSRISPARGVWIPRHSWLDVAACRFVAAISSTPETVYSRAEKPSICAWCAILEYVPRWCPVMTRMQQGVPDAMG